MTQTWDPGQGGVLELPSGRLIRGRGLLMPFRPARGPSLACTCWDGARRRCLGFPVGPLAGFPPAGRRRRHPGRAQEAWRRAETERVEVACWGGRGRTGTALACLAVLDGVPPAEAVAFVRARYRRGAVETPWQRKYVARFQRPG